MGLYWNQLTQNFTNEYGQPTDETGRLLSNTQPKTTPAPTPAPVATPQPATPQVVVSTGSTNNLIQGIRDSLSKGLIDGDTAKKLLADRLAAQYGGYMIGDSPQFPGGKGQNEYYNALPTLTTELFKNLNAVSKGQTGTYDLQGNFIKQSTTSNVSKTGSTGTTSTTSAIPSQKTASSLPLSSGGYQVTPNGLYFDQARGTYYNQNYQQVDKNGGVIAGTTSGAPTLSPQEVDAQLQAWGIDPNSVDPSMKGTLAAIGEVWAKQFESGRISSADVQAAYNQALQDPDILKKYGDALKIGQADFTQAITDYQSELTQGLSDYGRKFIQQNKDLAEKEAAAGRALSGFREQAKQNLSADQSSIVESTRRTTQKAVDTLGKSFEKTFGTSATPIGNMLTFQNPLTQVNENLTYRPYSGITGTNPLQQTQDTFAKRDQLLQLNPIA